MLSNGRKKVFRYKKYNYCWGNYVVTRQWLAPVSHSSLLFLKADPSEECSAKIYHYWIRTNEAFLSVAQSALLQSVNKDNDRGDDTMLGKLALLFNHISPLSVFFSFCYLNAQRKERYFPPVQETIDIRCSARFILLLLVQSFLMKRFLTAHSGHVMPPSQVLRRGL